MSKYIIDIPDNVKKIVYFHLGNANAVWTTSNDLDDLEQLNSDYINENFGELQDEAYQRGLDDAWEAAKKIFGYEMDGGIPLNEIGKVFGYAEDAIFCTADIIRHNTAAEAIEKLKAYEEKQKADDEIKVGDEVKHKSDRVAWTAIVTRICCGTLTLMEHSGASADNYPIEDFVKTGRHFDILSILEDMRND